MRIVQYYMPTSNSNVIQMEEDVFYKLIEKVIEIIKGEKKSNNYE